jgi:hypothetical protein
LNDDPDYPSLSRSHADGITVLSGFGRPFGLARDGEGRIYVADMDLHAICRLDPDLGGAQWLGSRQMDWSAAVTIKNGETGPAPARKPGRFDGPHSVAIGNDGRIYVVTYYSPGLQILSADGRAISAVKRNAIEFAGPATGHFDRMGRLLVTEYKLHAVVALSADAEFAGAIGGGHDGFVSRSGFAPGSEKAQFDRPHMCRARSDHALIVADTWNHRLQLFSAEGRFLGMLTSGMAGWRECAVAPEATAEPGRFSAPVAISFANDGRFVVTDWGNNRLQWFDHDGRFLKIDQLGLDRPYDAQIFREQIAIADSHHGRILLKDI